MRVSCLAARMLVCALVVPVTLSAALNRRVALVIGNQAYRGDAQLGNPVADARLIGRVLHDSLHFDVVQIAENVDHRSLQRLVAGFSDLAHGAETAVFYFSGHGMQDGESNNYLIPIDAQIEELADLKSQAVATADLVEAARNSGAKVSLLILDACRNNPFIKGRKGMAERGLARQDISGDNLLIAYATAEMRVAVDGPSGGNSPYATSLAARLESASSVPLLKILDLVKNDVRTATHGNQIPTRYGDMEVDTYLMPLSTVAQPSLPAIANGLPSEGNRPGSPRIPAARVRVPLIVHVAAGAEDDDPSNLANQLAARLADAMLRANPVVSGATAEVRVTFREDTHRRGDRVFGEWRLDVADQPSCSLTLGARWFGLGGFAGLSQAKEDAVATAYGAFYKHLMEKIAGSAGPQC